MSGKAKSLALAISYTIATVIAYSVLWLFGEADGFDWRFWVGAMPALFVCLVFGILASGWKEIVKFSFINFSIDLIFLFSTLFFSPETWTPAIELYGGSVERFVATMALVALPFSFSLISLGAIIGVTYRSVSTRPPAA